MKFINEQHDSQTNFECRMERLLFDRAGHSIWSAACSARRIVAGVRDPRSTILYFNFQIYAFSIHGELFHLFTLKEKKFVENFPFICSIKWTCFCASELNVAVVYSMAFWIDVDDHSCSAGQRQGNRTNKGAANSFISTATLSCLCVCPKAPDPIVKRFVSEERKNLITISRYTKCNEIKYEMID